MNFSKSLKISIIFLIIFAWIFSGFPRIWHNPRIPPEIQVVKAANYLTNPSFTGGTTGWTLTTTVYDSTYYQDTAGSIKTATAVGKSKTATGSAQQTISTNIIGGSTVLLSLYWSKQCVGASCSINTIQVDIAKPSAPSTWVTIWSDTSIPAAGSATAWTGPSNLDVSSYFNETGQYQIRLYANLKSAANNTSAQALAWFDNINLNVIPPTYTQAAYRFYNNIDSTDVGTPLADLNTAASLSYSGQAFRLRLLLGIDTSSLAQSGQSFKLQYAQKVGSICGDDEIFSDITSTSTIAFYDNPTPSNGTNLTANANDPTDGSRTIVNQTYQEANPFTNSSAAIPSGQDGKWDFSLKDNGASANTAYCFRVVKSDGSLLDTYTVIPQITTASATIISVSVSDGTIAYGMLPLNTSKSTCTSELNDAQIVTNNGNVTENFLIRGQNSANWILAATAGTDQYVHKFLNGTCSTFSGGTTLTTSDQTFATGIAPNGTATLNLQITTPTATNYFTQQSVNVTITAVQQ